MRAIACALTLVLAPGLASAATFEEVVSHVNVNAISGDAEAYAKQMAKGERQCGLYGSKNKKLRAAVLIARYQALAAAVAAGDETATMAAGKSLHAAIDRNGRFSECWRYIARRSDISSRLARRLEGI